jgi:maltooligosyltrehalose trehalohydrolase
MTTSALAPGWSARLGAIVDGDAVRFRVWAPVARAVELVVEDGSARVLALQPGGDGFFETKLDEAGPGTRYRYRVDGRGPFPDPASRRQPLGVHGPSEVVDASRFAWTDGDWPGIGMADLVIYELHVGTFTPLGTFAGVREKLSTLRELGITAIELMPVADFPGQRNWGYDGVCPFAPARCYGANDELRAVVDAAHGMGLAVLLDVVYNHLGPDGNYLGAFSPFINSESHHTPWGQAINLDGPSCGPVRGYFIENALHWLCEYHFDGLRLDATHALVDESPHHLLAELAARAHALPGPRRLVIAEDERNLAAIVRPEHEGGMSLDGVWADDFHHQVRRRLAGDSDGYFADFSGTADDVAETIARGFFFRGQMVPRLGRPRGSDPSGIPAERFVFCIQNHDQIGNRALGERLHHQIDAASYRAALALLLLSPETPLLFMGQEWAASSPFLYFTDHNQALGRLVTEGRRSEFKSFAAFSSPDARARIPDPQDEATFARSRLIWEERGRELHAQVLQLHRALLDVRRRAVSRARWQGTAVGPSAVLLRYAEYQVATCLEGSGHIDVSSLTSPTAWTVVLDTEAPAFAGQPRPPRIEPAGDRLRIAFQRPGAVILRKSGPSLEP